MKHLEKFNWFRKNEVSEEDIKDILLEVEDLGMTTVFGSGHNYNYLKVTTSEDEVYSVYWKDIKDCVLRLKSYLGGKFIYFAYVNNFFYSTGNSIRQKINDKTVIEEPIRSFEIKYDK